MCIIWNVYIFEGTFFQVCTCVNLYHFLQPCDNIIHKWLLRLSSESSYLDDIIDNIADSDYCSALMSGSERHESATSQEDERRENKAIGLRADEIPPPPFRTPEKLQPIRFSESIKESRPVPTLRLLAVALAQDGIFRREVLAENSLSGCKGTGVLDQAKLEYIKTLVRTRVPRSKGYINLMRS